MKQAQTVCSTSLYRVLNTAIKAKQQFPRKRCDIRLMQRSPFAAQCRGASHPKACDIRDVAAVISKFLLQSDLFCAACRCATHAHQVSLLEPACRNAVLLQITNGVCISAGQPCVRRGHVWTCVSTPQCNMHASMRASLWSDLASQTSRVLQKSCFYLITQDAVVRYVRHALH